MKNIAVIPARGGSKRIPHKNIKPFYGKPIIAYSIELAKNTNIFDEIIVSTDDFAIARIAEKYGAQVPFVRDKNLSDDFTGKDAVVLDAVNKMEKQGFYYDFVTCIYATAPFIKKEFLLRAFDLLKQGKCDGTYSVAANNHPIFRDRKINEKGYVELIWPENLYKRSQDFFETYYDAGQFYMAKTDALKKEKSFECIRKCIPTIIPQYLANDIDTEEDWIRAEIMYQNFFLSAEG